MKVKIAFTTSDRIHVNAHFGWAKEIDVYEISDQGYEFRETLKFDGDLKEDGNEDKITPKLEALHDCTIVYVLAIGGSAAARLIKHGVTPVKSKSEEEEIAEILNKLVQTLKGNPPPWLRKALGQKKSNFLEEVENEAAI
ncbi:nitrogen fixation protein NifX [Cylindrospermopsis raciborskii]|uniref:Nitrogen fixation protein NifX n=1 Tax=Cylindrospermopsis raciborskii CENA302 TaxID=1170768 RepID=A0A9Q5QX03_9CYAN|nr:nitrogen fixation protein NifX [Cylindrospermopsis raciborskii]MCZ2200643.1 nitrogen fixation protein NifX [Cylindrospermopsis raciborskii PAMP2012]MCZ2205618.1 nitrogen fixation protein NifX [Cylindrospermopsis raciborskii PAMP2011]NLQ05722.1 nitrogen fixation protein NifX [Cylindrospermopsis raciborskii MVCC19]OHY36363.1 nitrogen fixation protein NifX [Cylindrospermopsis raciborskii MVCC14]OPH09786.1 nitrogen fixation protein NifX [Cylindrospermopsis raciborskii CENA302]